VFCVHGQIYFNFGYTGSFGQTVFGLVGRSNANLIGLPFLSSGPYFTQVPSLFEDTQNPGRWVCFRRCSACFLSVSPSWECSWTAGVFLGECQDGAVEHCWTTRAGGFMAASKDFCLVHSLAGIFGPGSRNWYP
jgi:hypothetical protein